MAVLRIHPGKRRSGRGSGSGGGGGVAPETAVYAAMRHAREPEPRNACRPAATGSERARAGGLGGSEPRSPCDTGTSEASGRGARAAATRRATMGRRSRATATTRRPGPGLTPTRRGTPRSTCPSSKSGNGGTWLTKVDERKGARDGMLVDAWCFGCRGVAAAARDAWGVGMFRRLKFFTSRCRRR